MFDVKAFRLFTLHQTPLDALPAEVRERLGKIEKKNVYYDDLPAAARDDLWERFRSALEPLRAEGKLGAVVFQFPPWVVNRRSNREHVLECAAAAARRRHRRRVPQPHLVRRRQRRAHARLRA